MLKEFNPNSVMPTGGKLLFELPWDLNHNLPALRYALRLCATSDLSIEAREKELLSLVDR